ncbi:MAG: histidine--tRNA ligase [Clostridia bacterium]|nr:histidine--tRNA ligase [Clostridia bacterium]
MAIIKAPRGTNDVLPQDSFKWRYIESVADKTAETAGYREIRFPTFEETELFTRGVGDTTDIVQKEMYTFEDKGGRSMTLRPEGTASAVRLSLENGLLGGALPLKLYYKINVFRYDKPQAGRYREFNQIGMELYGATSPYADAELISLAKLFLENLGIEGTVLKINSIGCPECRADYQNALREYFTAHYDELCDTCKGRLQRNPMRILDCKSPQDIALAKNAPKITDYLCEECREHYSAVKAALDSVGIAYEEDSGLVRGLDYYTKTVFVFIDTNSSLAVAAGGRYDGLIEELGGKPTPGIGFACGVERLFPLIPDFGKDSAPDIYIASMGPAAAKAAFETAFALRKNGIKAETDLMSRSVKAQMKYADKTGARFTAVLGDEELEKGKADIRNMKNGEIVKSDFRNISELTAILKNEIHICD